ncbi:ATP-dependent nuclease [Lentzea sp.]|uniref:ATP-dependent nuclease n=1 Tax=Lentzea sp. TaxID=56099 RepID=UPI002ED45798
MDKTHKALSSMLEAGKFEPFIRHIRFPYFRNIREGTRVDFTHPITALVGPNGTNKTAVLRALQGCPDYYNVGQYWFSTSLDPIDNVDRHRFIHGYIAPSTGQVVEVIKTRIVRGENPDYFEPSRPIIGDGMQAVEKLKPGETLPSERTQTRWKAIKKTVEYLDFRSELSAYDKFFFHVPYRKGGATLTEKKAFIRRRSPHIAESLASGRAEHSFFSSPRIVSPGVDATERQCYWISRILGRKYEKITFLTHKYLDVEGSTVILRYFGLRYSEAFAGSGEFAVAMLVKKVSEAKDGSLILLDEPEVSLHPGAQGQLMEFLAEQSKLKKLQIVISTHSPEIVRGLPPEAIKVFHSSAADGKVELVSQESDASEAFFRLGVRLAQEKTIYVEDKLAQAIVRRAIRPLGESASAQLKIASLPGGADGIQQRFVPAFALAENDRSLVLLDGDKKPKEDAVEPSKVSEDKLEEVVTLQLGGKPQLSLNGAGGVAAAGDKEKQLRAVLAWIYANVDYLPGDTPEALLLEMEGLAAEVDGGKEDWVTRTARALGREEWETVTSAEILTEQERALAAIEDSNPVLEYVRARVRAFLEQH